MVVSAGAGRKPQFPDRGYTTPAKNRDKQKRRVYGLKDRKHKTAEIILQAVTDYRLLAGLGSCALRTDGAVNFKNRSISKLSTVNKGLSLVLCSEMFNKSKSKQSYTVSKMRNIKLAY